MGDDFTIEAWTELALAVLSIFLRLYFSITQRGWTALNLDDYLMVVAGVRISSGEVIDPIFLPVLIFTGFLPC